ncbi:MAG: glycosyltransferase [Myxococcota bacterium]
MSQQASQTQPRVTIIIVPRESFGYTQESLESLYRDTRYPFELIYIDGGSPPSVRRYLEEQSAARSFELIRTHHFISPNKARNLGLSRAEGEYVVIADNDIIFQPGWLGRLVECAEQTGAAIVGPLSCIGHPLHENIHNGGGRTSIGKSANGASPSKIEQQTFLAGRKVSSLNDDELARFRCDYVEFHTVLVRRSLFDEIGPLDERLLSTREHIDMCLLAGKLGESIYCERRSITTYVPGVTLKLSDVAYFMLRWSDAWDLASLAHFQQKWGLREDEYFYKRYKKLGKRRQRAIIAPVVNKLTFGREAATNILKAVELRVQRGISEIYGRKHPYARHSVGLTRGQKLARRGGNAR